MERACRFFVSHTHTDLIFDGRLTVNLKQPHRRVNGPAFAITETLHYSAPIDVLAVRDAYHCSDLFVYTCFLKKVCNLEGEAVDLEHVLQFRYVRRLSVAFCAIAVNSS